MGFFSSPEDKYSNERHAVTDEVIKRLVSQARASTLSQTEESEIELALHAKKHEHNGKLSLRDIYLVLHKLRLSHAISEQDEHEVMKDLKVVFENK